MEELILKTSSGVKSKIYCGEDAMGIISSLTSGRECFLLTDSNVYRLYREYINKTFGYVPLFVLPAGEESKTFSSLEKILGAMIGFKLHRNARLFALGGGVIGDIGGLAASLYMRGIECVQIPTTLLSQVDSSVGGKTAVDYGNVKNVIGSFYQPGTVVADPFFFGTLPQREIRCGLGEIVKYAALNGDIFDTLCKNEDRLFDPEFLKGIVKDCISHKISVVERDERETGERKSLNMGHTTGHAFELYYGDRSHGEFVLIGMYYEILYAEENGLCDLKYSARLKSLILKVLGCIPNLKDKVEACSLAKMDKKNRSADEINMVIPVSKGEWREISVGFREYSAFLKRKE